jgi:glyoxylase-like metal-dependent hydrolase (beta-lactamase superfamily II)
LSYETLVSDGLVRASGAKLPSGEPIASSPITSVLIFGKTDALLVDPPLSLEQTRKVGDWIERSGKHLKVIYSTHGHGDHWFGSKQLLDRFPGAIAYATPGTIALMQKQATQGRQRIYDKDFPGQIGETPVLAQPVPAEGFELEGNLIQPIEVGHSDTDDTTVLYVPSLGLVAAGDVAYNGVHQYLLDGGHGGLDAWLRALDKVEALKPRIVIAGHKNKALADDPKILGETRQYLLDAKRLLAENPTPQAYFEQMLALYPNRLNRGPLWYSGVGLLAQQEKGPAMTAATHQ